MAGIDTGASQGIYFQAKQFGSILRGLGPPVPQAGLVGDLYVDTQTWLMYTKRSPESGGGVDPWGNPLFTVPVTYQAQLKWFSASAPDDSVGVIGDYALLWAGFGNYGLQLSVYGPKNAFNTWNENGNGPNTQIDPTYAGFVWPLGLSDEGTQAAYSASTQLIVAGLVDEYILATPVANIAGTLIGEVGVQSSPTPVAVALNALYTASNQYAI